VNAFDSRGLPTAWGEAGFCERFRQLLPGHVVRGPGCGLLPYCVVITSRPRSARLPGLRSIRSDTRQRTGVGR